MTRTLRRRLGFGKDGEVWVADNANAIKVFERFHACQREGDVYARLASLAITSINGSDIPNLVEKSFRSVSLR